jgi:DSF synthase
MDETPSNLDTIHGLYRQLVVRYDRPQGIAWYYLDPKPRPCFNPGLLEELKAFQGVVGRINGNAHAQGKECPFPYIVLASGSPGVFSLGGDLDLFVRLVRQGDAEALRRYARACIDVLYTNAVNYDLPVTTISLVQGEALGGGFEAAVSSNVIVAERSARFGLPEVLFNLFPGMGAYNLIARRLDAARAERIILSGDVYGARELHEMGLVDVLAEDGGGEKAVADYIARHSRRGNAFRSVVSVRQRLYPVDYDELMDIGEIWVGAAMKLSPRDLKIMERLVRAQDRSGGGPAGSLPDDRGTLGNSAAQR